MIKIISTRLDNIFKLHSDVIHQVLALPNCSTNLTEASLQLLDNYFITLFKALSSSFGKFGFLLKKFYSQKRNRILSGKKFLPPGSAPHFQMIADRFLTELKIDAFIICPKQTKEEVRLSDSQIKELLTSNGDYSLFGNCSVNLHVLAKASVISTRQFFSGFHIKPIPLRKICDEILSKPTSSGIPYFTKKNLLDKDLIYLESIELIENFSLTKLLDFGSMGGHRYQVRPKDKDNFSVKARVIIIFSLFMLLLQAYSFAPLLVAFSLKMETSPFCSQYFSPEKLSVIMHNLRLKCAEKQTQLVNIDFSKFDTSIKPYMKLSFYICMFPFASVQSFYMGFETFSLIYWSVALFSTFHAVYFNSDIPDVLSGSTLSGEYITSFSNTWYHLTAINYYCILNDITPEIDTATPDICIQGDDGIYLTSVINPTKFQESCLSLGLNITIENIKIFDDTDNDVHYLGRYFDRFNRPYQTKNWFISHSVYPGNYQPGIPFKQLLTVRHYSLAYPFYNSAFAINMYSRVDSHILSDMDEFFENINHEVQVQHFDKTLYKVRFIEFYDPDRFVKHDHLLNSVYIRS
jgi:hypothetical protein